MNEAWIPAVTALAGVALGELLAHIRSKSTALREEALQEFEWVSESG